MRPNFDFSVNVSNLLRSSLAAKQLPQNPILDKQKVSDGKMVYDSNWHPVMESLWKVNRTGRNGAQTDISLHHPMMKQDTLGIIQIRCFLNLPNMGHRDMQELTTSRQCQRMKEN